MAILSPMEWEIDAATGNDNYGGGYDGTSGSPGTNFAWGGNLQASPESTQVISWLAAGGTYTNDLACTNATPSVMTSASRATALSNTGGFRAADVGNVINITAGTSWTAGRYQIISVDVNGNATLDRKANVSTTSGSAGSGYLGGAMASIVAAFIQSATTPMVAGNKLWLKYNATPYALPSAITAGVTGGSYATPVGFFGYYSSHSDNPSISGGHQPTIVASTYALGLATYWSLAHLTITSAATSGYCVTGGAASEYYNCKFTGTGGAAILSPSTNSIVFHCEIAGAGSSTTGYGVAVNTATVVANCYIHDCGIGIFAAGTAPTTEYNIIDSCNEGIRVLTNTIHNGNTIVNCVKGYNTVSAIKAIIKNSLIAYCGTGISWSAEADACIFMNNNIYGCTTPTSNLATNAAYAPIGGATNNPLFNSTILTGTDGVTGTPDTVFTAASANFSSVTTSDTIMIWAGTSAVTGYRTITAVAPGGDNTALTISTGIGAGLTGLTWCIVRGSNLTLQPTSPCIGAGYGINLGVS
jgi:hypothetical protein